MAVIDSTKWHPTYYLDALEMDMQPEEESRYWVLPCIVEYMNDRFDEGLLKYIQKNERYGMKFIAEDYEEVK